LELRLNSGENKTGLFGTEIYYEYFNASIVSDSPVNGSDMLTVYSPSKYPSDKGPAHLEVRITPENANNPPNKCCIQARVESEYSSGGGGGTPPGGGYVPGASAATVYVIDSCTTTVNF
jgi:hypothetical protein